MIVGQDEGKIGCGCEDMNVVVYQPKFDKSTRQRLEMMQNSYALTSKPAIDAMFYFNFAVRGMKATA